MNQEINTGSKCSAKGCENGAQHQIFSEDRRAMVIFKIDIFDFGIKKHI
jgi:hypothetical protein